MTTIDLNADLGEGFGPWRMGDDGALLRVVTSNNIQSQGGEHHRSDRTTHRFDTTNDRGDQAGVEASKIHHGTKRHRSQDQPDGR